MSYLMPGRSIGSLLTLVACVLLAQASAPSDLIAAPLQREQAEAEGNASQEERPAEKGETKDKPHNDDSSTPEPPEIDEANLQRLHPEHRVWFDNTNKLVVIDGEVCLRKGPLEVFACPRGTKEHESVVRVFSPALFVHAGLLRVGAIPGKPVSFDPEYRAAEGMIIDVWVYWKDGEGKLQKTRGQEWVRHSDTKKQLEQNWVFGGSGFWTDEETGERFYQAEGGELVCVSNFSTATMDLPIESSQSNNALLFEPFTERIPDRGTPLRVVLKPRIPPKPKAEGADKSSAKPDDSDGSPKQEQGQSTGQGKGSGKVRDPGKQLR